MFLTKEERKEVMSAFGLGDSTEINHYDVGSDTWIYLFEYKNKKYILVATDYLGDYEFDIFPHLLKFENDKLEFVLRIEVSIKNESLLKRIRANTALFEYTN